jgi:hypothetical protein
MWLHIQETEERKTEDILQRNKDNIIEEHAAIS